MPAPSCFITKSLAGALLNALLFASAASAADNPELIAFARGNRSLLATSSISDDMRPASSDTFEPMLSTGEELNSVSVDTDPFGSVQIRAKSTSNILKANRTRSSHSEGGQLQRLSDSLRSSHIFPSSSRFRIIRQDSTLSLSTYRHPSGRDLDMKIDTLLVAKELLRNRDFSVDRINVYFFNPNDQSAYTITEISLDLVRQFDAGRVSDDAIFQALQLRNESLGLKLNNLAKQSYQKIATTLSPGDGILLKERIELFNKLERMQRIGTGVENLQAACLLLEDAVRQNDEPGARAAYAYALEVFENANLQAGISSAK